MPYFQSCTIQRENEFQRQYQPTSEQVVVHNLNLDKIEVHRKLDILSSLPYEIPSQSLLSSLLHYKEILTEIEETAGLKSDAILSYKLVHLENIKDHQ